jgi:hypothetical protein
MLRVFGIPISQRDARPHTAILIADGRPLEMEAAARIGEGSDQDDRDVATLSIELREAILTVLEDPHDSLLELRGRLARDRAERRSSEGLGHGESGHADVPAITADAAEIAHLLSRFR